VLDLKRPIREADVSAERSLSLRGRAEALLRWS